MSRLPIIAASDYTADQTRAAEAFERLRGAPVFGPFELMMHSPEAMTRTQELGEYLRYKSAIGAVLSEFVILIVARHWDQAFEWHVHQPIALKVGIGPAIVAAIAEARRPEAMSADETLLWDFATQLLETRRVSDAVFAQARARFGERGCVDISAIVGYYSLLAMQMNAAEYQPPSGGPILPARP